MKHSVRIDRVRILPPIVRNAEFLVRTRSTKEKRLS